MLNRYGIMSYLDSTSDEFGTPQELFDELNKEFNFVLDAAASERNHKCLWYYSKEDDALTKNWNLGGVVFCNPPYSRGNVAAFVKKGYEESLKGVTVVLLLPARTEQAWFHDYVSKGEVRFIRKRVKYEGGKTSARFPSMIVVFRGVQPSKGE